MKYSKPITVLVLISGLLLSCQQSTTISKNLINGLNLKGKGLTSETVYVTNGEESIRSNKFIYGEKFYIIFDDVRGFNKNEERVFPGMQLVVKNRKGEILINEKDLYENETGGVDLDPLQLQSNLLIADPLHSGEIYSFNVRIWDKMGDGEITANFRFKVVHNPAITVDSEDIAYNEIYLYSTKDDRVITNNQIGIGETILMGIEGLDGFISRNGQSSIGIRMKAVDQNGKIIVDETDLLEDQLIDTKVLQEAFNPSLVISDESVVSPINYTILVWDKIGNNRIHVQTKLKLQ